MKTQNQFKLVIATMTLFTIFITSCQKESSINPSSGVISQSNDESARIRNCNSSVFPTNACMYGRSYSQWSAKWWKWGMEHAITGHPFNDDPSFNVTSGQSGQVWFLAAPFGTVTRNVNIPHGKALFVGLLNAEASSLEGLGNTATDQRANAKFNADHIINLTCSIDGNNLSNVNSYRFVSPQFPFTAPTPWIYGATGGNSTAVGDGYYIMVKPLSHGAHTLHYTGSFHFAIAEGDPFDFDADLNMTYNLNIQ